MEEEIHVGDKVIFEYESRSGGKVKWGKGTVEYVREPVSMWGSGILGIQYGFLNLRKKVVSSKNAYLD